MANIAKRADGHWRARYRDAHGKEHARHFNRKIDAQNWLDSVTTAMQTGVYVDPNRGKITIGDWSARWLDGQAHPKPSTHERYADILREHVLPQWSTVQLIDVTHADVQAWVLAAGGAALAGDGAQGSSRVFTHRQDGRQGRSTGAEPGSRDQPAAGRRHRAPIPHPRAGACIGPGAGETPRKSVSTAASTSARIGPTD